jgi:predicted RNA-binding protein with PUA domain
MEGRTRCVGQVKVKLRERAEVAVATPECSRIEVSVARSQVRSTEPSDPVWRFRTDLEMIQAHGVAK